MVSLFLNLYISIIKNYYLKTLLMKRALILILFFCITFNSYAQQLFQFKYKTGQRFHIEGTIDEDLYKNDVLVQSVRIKNIGDLTITKLSGNWALHEGVFEYYKSTGISGDFVLEKTYPTRFFRDIYGNYEIEDFYFMPVVRGVPTFPKTPLEIGDQWRSNAYEAHDFRDVFGISNPVILPASVSYQYLGDTLIDGNKIAKISINYVINYTLKYLSETRFDTSLPYRVIGYFNQLYLWNLDEGIPHSYRENFDYIFILSNGEILEYIGKSQGALTAFEEIAENGRIIDKIKNKLKDSIPSVEVTRTPQGIVINIGEILFKFDSDDLTASADEDLSNIVDVLKEFPERKIKVVGHTDSTGPEDYNLSLSLRRAKKTVQEIKNRMPLIRDRITYMGKGESKPIASNETEEGRRKNRRVEIIILNK